VTTFACESLRDKEACVRAASWLSFRGIPDDPVKGVSLFIQGEDYDTAERQIDSVVDDCHLHDGGDDELALKCVVDIANTFERIINKHAPAAVRERLYNAVRDACGDVFAAVGLHNYLGRFDHMRPKLCKAPGAR
jgi:hypothetical protein